MKNRKYVWIAAAAVYLVLLVLLVHVESGAPNATIRSFPEALWYTLTTLTTVGYGDTYPVTVPGRLIGILFLLMSLGVLAVLVGLLLSLLRGELLPRIYLRLYRNREWYIFTEQNLPVSTLASALLRENPDRVVIHAGWQSQSQPPQGLWTAMDLGKLLKRHDGRGHTYLFLFGEDQAENCRLAEQFAGPGRSVYALTAYEPEHLDEGVTLLDPAVCCARRYWKQRPLAGIRETIALIGSGPWAEAILEQGLLQNVLASKQKVRYLLLGDFSEFRRNHPGLDQICRPGAPGEGMDGLVYLEGPWNAHLEALKQAERIVLCGGTRQERLEKLILLRRYCPVTAQVHMQDAPSLEGVESFGSLEEIYSPEVVLGGYLSSTARALHEIYRSENPAAPRWEELSCFARRSNLAAADHLETKLRILLQEDAPEKTAENCLRACQRFENASPEQREEYREIEHIRWMRFHLLFGWRYGPVRDDLRRLHPLLKPYSQLSREDQQKDDYPWQVLGVLAKLLG